MSSINLQFEMLLLLFFSLSQSLMSVASKGEEYPEKNPLTMLFQKLNVSEEKNKEMQLWVQLLF